MVIVAWYGFKMVQGILTFFGVGRKVWKQDFICCGNTVSACVQFSGFIKECMIDTD